MNVPEHKKPAIHTITVSIGSNIHHEQNIIAALDALAAHYGKLQCSPVYKSAANTAIESEKHRVYYNLVARFSSSESTDTCKQTLYRIEQQQGRKRNHSDVSCDIDLLTYNTLCGTFNNIKLPHKDILSCDYVLRPLADLAPTEQHPENRKNYGALWQEFSKTSTLEPVELQWQGELLSIKPVCLPL